MRLSAGTSLLHLAVRLDRVYSATPESTRAAFALRCAVSFDCRTRRLHFPASASNDKAAIANPSELFRKHRPPVSLSCLQFRRKA